MKNKRTSGISLVALIVTIIVLIILTAAVIVTFMEGGIIERAKEAVFKSDIRTYQEILAVKNAEEQIKLATGNGEGGLLNADDIAEIQEIIPEFKEEYKDLVAISNGEIVLGSREDNPYRDWLAELGIGVKQAEAETKIPIVHNGIIPEGGTYYIRASEDMVSKGDYLLADETITAGNYFPETTNIGDVYVYGDYEYRKGYSFTGDFWQEEGDGWGVSVIDETKSEYGKILTTINNVDVMCMCYTFQECCNLITAPRIPTTIDHMYGTFEYCTNLTGIIEINNNVTYISSIFDCTEKQIILTGNCSMLNEVAEEYDNVELMEE